MPACEVQPAGGYPELRKDLRDVEASDLAGFDAVMHLAALSNDPLGDLDPNLTYAINREASVRLAEVAKQAGVRRFLFASSCSVYGVEGDSMADEDSTLSPLTPYAESKVLVERDLKRLAGCRLLPGLSALRHGLRRLADAAFRRGRSPIWSATRRRPGRSCSRATAPPGAPRSICATSSRPIWSCCEAPAAAIHDQPFNVGSTAENLRIRELATHVAEAVPGSTLVFAEGASPDKRSYRVSCDKIAAALPNFRPTWTTRTGAREHYEAFRSGYYGTRAVRGAAFHADQAHPRPAGRRHPARRPAPGRVAQRSATAKSTTSRPSTPPSAAATRRAPSCLCSGSSW